MSFNVQEYFIVCFKLGESCSM